MANLQEQRAKLESLLDNQIDCVSGLPINCHNCVHSKHHSRDVSFDQCMKCGGIYCKAVHNYPSLYGHLCKNYSAWSPRQKSILELISDKIRKILA